MSSIHNNVLIAYNAISNFVKDLSSVFGSSQHSLKLYEYLLAKTTLSHSKPLEKHIESFRNFCIENRESILSKNFKTFTLNSIDYSDRVYINIGDIFTMSDAETREVIWNHLLTLSAILDPESTAKNLLKKVNLEHYYKKTLSLEDFFEKTFERIRELLEGEQKDFIKCGLKIVQSGLLTEIVNDVTNNLDIENLDMQKVALIVTNFLSKRGMDMSEIFNVISNKVTTDESVSKSMQNLFAKIENNPENIEVTQGENININSMMGSLTSVMGPMMQNLMARTENGEENNKLGSMINSLAPMMQNLMSQTENGEREGGEGGEGGERGENLDINSMINSLTPMMQNLMSQNQNQTQGENGEDFNSAIQGMMQMMSSQITPQ